MKVRTKILRGFDLGLLLCALAPLLTAPLAQATDLYRISTADPATVIRVDGQSDLLIQTIERISRRQVRVVVRNRGHKGTDPCRLSFEIYRGIMAEIVFERNVRVSPLRPGAVYTIYFNTLGRSTEGNSIKATVDVTDVVPEVDEDNNESSLITAP